MITRAQIRRQLRAQGGITNTVPRTGFLLGGIKKRIRKLIPNELADFAVKAAPFVAPFQPGIAAAMRGIGRFDQRGSVSDALKQGLGTYALGRGARFLTGAEGTRGGPSTFSMDRFREGPVGRLFKKPLTEGDPNFTGGDANKGDLLGTKPTPATTAKGLKSIRDATSLFKDVPILGELPSMVQQQILVGGATAAGTYLYNAFLAEEPPQEEGETMKEYLARRKENVGNKMRAYFDNYFAFDKEYSAMTDEEKDAFVARYNLRGGGMPMGIMRTNQAGVMERDYRDKGGFVPVGVKEKADDVPAMLSKNEFVMTANAVRGAGNGSIEKGAQRMYDTMKKLEGRVR
jgi:hypothetical protein